MRRRALLTTLHWLLMLLGFFILPCCLPAQDLSEETGIRQTAQQILAEPEFRYFEHLGDSPERPQSRFERQQVGFGSEGGNSGGNGARGEHGSAQPGNARNDARGADRNRPGDASASDSNSGGDSSTTTIPLSGGLGAVGGVFGAIFHALAYLILIAVCVLIIFLVVTAIMSREPSSSVLTSPQMNFDLAVEEDHSPGELPADAYLAKARELAAQRRYREAVSYLLLGGMSAVERAQLIRHRRGLTLRDYLRSLRGKSPQFDGFQSMIGLYEPVGFGRRVASQITFDQALAGYEQAVAPLGP